MLILYHRWPQFSLVIIVLLGVSFLGAVVQWDGSPNILALGLGIGAVLAAYALLLKSGGRLSAGGSKAQSQEPDD